MTGNRPPAETGFDWQLYADATFAGLAVLIPVPLLDVVFERFFRRRMAPAIAARKGRSLPPPVRVELNRSSGGCLGGCLAAPITAVLWLITRLSRKILYVLTIKDATDQLSYYWQRAFLLAHMLDQGHLQSLSSAAAAREAMEAVLDTTAGPLGQLAQQVIAGARHIARTLWRARRGGEDEVTRQTRARMRASWAAFDDYFTALAERYDRAYQGVVARSPRQ
jgi:hypothetical protein